MRDDHPAAGTVPSHCARSRRSGPAGDDHARQIRRASAAEPAKRTFALEGIDLSVSTLADWVGACTSALSPLVTLIAAHVLAAERLHGDDTTVPGAGQEARPSPAALGLCARRSPVRRPDAPGAIFYYSRDRGGRHPCRHLEELRGILQADAYAGFNDLYHEARKPGPIIEAACWAHGRRKLFVLADLAKAPLAIEAVRRIDAIFDVEREINGLTAEQRLAIRQVRVAPLVTRSSNGCAANAARLSRHADVAKAMDYMLKRWDAFTRFLDDGRICLTNNAAERGLRGIALGRKAWLFAGSDRGGERAAAMYSLIVTAKLNDVDPRAWLADVLSRIADHPVCRLHELLPWHWRQSQIKAAAAA